MKILNEEHFENVKRYAESIGDTSFQKCLDRLESWGEESPTIPMKYRSTTTMPRIRSASRNAIPMEEPASWEACFITEYRTGLLPSHWNRSTDGRYIPDRNKRKSNINIVLT